MTHPHRQRQHSAHIDIIEKFYRDLPAFTDVFTEESFYIFAACFAAATIVLVFVLSRFITIKPVVD